MGIKGHRDRSSRPTYLFVGERTGLVVRASDSGSGQGQLLEGLECHIYLYCFTFDGIDLNRAFVVIVLFPKKYSNKKVCANDIGKLNALGFYWYNFF